MDFFEDGHTGYEYIGCGDNIKFYSDTPESSPREIEHKLLDDSSSLIEYIGEIAGDDNILLTLLQSVTEEDLSRSIELSYERYNHPLILAYINTLPIIEYDKNKHTYADHCPISFVDFKNGSKIKVMPCNHYYDPESIDNWLKMSTKCPVCKFDLKSNFI